MSRFMFVCLTMSLLSSAGSNAGYQVGDLTEDEKVDLADLRVFTGQWLVDNCPEDGLVSHWRLDDDSSRVVIDSCGDNDGLISGNPIWVAGVKGKALYFDGDGDWVDVPNDPSLNFTEELTVSAWVRVDEWDRHWQAIATKGNNEQWRLTRHGGEDYLDFAVNVGGTMYECTGSKDITGDRWHHITGRYNGQNVYLYVDGVQKAFKSTPGGNMSVSSAGLRIGGNSRWDAVALDGTIDDFRIYDRALSYEEVRLLASGGTSNPACADLDGLGGVDMVDLAILASHWLQGTTDFYHPLYIGGGGYWRQHINISVLNNSPNDVAGARLEINIGADVNQANLVGSEARAVRVVDDSGTEVLFSILGPGQEEIRTGVIPDGSTITIPVECEVNEVAKYSIYFDNPQAWEVPDFLRPSGLRNGGVEEGSGAEPDWWRHDEGDDDHRASWVQEEPHTGHWCLKTVVNEGAKYTWIATRQRNIPITGGARYRLSGWVRAENVTGSGAGWYIHVGNEPNSMMINRVIYAGTGQYDWRTVTYSFGAPEQSDRASVGTVLRGNGTAWFDDASLDKLGNGPNSLQATVLSHVTHNLVEDGLLTRWFDDDPNDNVYWDFRVPLQLLNPTDHVIANQLVVVNLRRFKARWRRLNMHSIRILYNNVNLPCYRFDDMVMFEAEGPAKTRRTYYMYMSLDDTIPAVYFSGLEGPIENPNNLVVNPSFESESGGLPTDWSAGPSGAEFSLESPGLFGNYCARINVPHDVNTTRWWGWRQDVPVEPDSTYWFAGWVRLDDIQSGSVKLHVHYRNAEGQLCEGESMVSLGPALAGTTDWTFLNGSFRTPPDIVTFQIHLTMNVTGTLYHDGIILRQGVGSPYIGPVEGLQSPDLQVWQVPAIVKVFRDDLPGRHPDVPRISAAGGEYEPLQLAVRSACGKSDLQIEIDPPVGTSGSVLNVNVGVVTYVPVDHVSDYVNFTLHKSWERVIVTGKPGDEAVLPSNFGQGSDGWADLWPDPILPTDTLNLPACATQPVWITVKVPENQPPGDYIGTFRVNKIGVTLYETPFGVHVWDFNLPGESNLTAIYDLRINSRWHVPGQSESETRRQLSEMMDEHRISPHIVPPPSIDYVDGNVVADYNEFDAWAREYVDTYDFRNLYMPLVFYCFGWANPPKVVFGEAPYPGEWPYEGADRSQLRPEYKQAYQACLGHFWDHLKAMGWEDRFVLYISDEPHVDVNGIEQQMIALCNMVHEVDANIPIYSSTWWHWPAWDGYLDIWGIGHYGIVPVSVMEQRLAAGDRVWFTTDGHMCTDTPYCGIERLLPYLCFKYGVDAYEFWGINWLSEHDPWKFGWHSPNRQVVDPAVGQITVLFPNGDGYLIYPGAAIDHSGPVTSLRLEQAREGMEDFEYMYLLRQTIERALAQPETIDVTEAQAALKTMTDLVEIPGPTGRYSTYLLPEPEALYLAREKAAEAIEDLLHQLTATSKRLNTQTQRVPSPAWIR